MADLPPLTPPDLDHAPWLDDEQHGIVRRSVLCKHVRPGYLVLFDPDHEHLSFGAASSLENASGNIQFGEVEPHFALVPRDHPSLDPRDLHSLFRMERRVVVVADGGDGAADVPGVTPPTTPRAQQAKRPAAKPRSRAKRPAAAAST